MLYICFCARVDFAAMVILWCCVDAVDAVNNDKKQSSMQRRRAERLEY